jgi:hypothetical protein
MRHGMVRKPHDNLAACVAEAIAFFVAQPPGAQVAGVDIAYDEHSEKRWYGWAIDVVWFGGTLGPGLSHGMTSEEFAHQARLDGYRQIVEEALIVATNIARE